MDKERRKLYPPDWEKISRSFRQSKNFTCEECGVTQGEERVSRKTGVVYQVYLHAAHENPHEKHDPQASLRCLCPTCHGRYDATLKRREQRITREKNKHVVLYTKVRKQNEREPVSFPNLRVEILT